MWVVEGNLLRGHSKTSKDIDIDELRHMKDYPVRMAQYRGSLYWSGNEGVDPDTQRPKGGVYGGDGRNGTDAAVVIEDVDLGFGNSEWYCGFLFCSIVPPETILTLQPFSVQS